jgi:large subunit ribosomal protein L30
MSNKIAVIRLRGTIGNRKEVDDTLDMLKLYRKNYCAVYEKTPSIVGMIQKVKDFVTFGEIDEETLKELRDKRLEKQKNNEGKEVEKKFFRLSPPRGGFERKGIKASFKSGGALGNRAEKINDLIKRMI